jgi:DNA-binding NtrC family response regulator
MKIDDIHLLLVHDEEAPLGPIGRVLKLYGFNVISVNSGNKALEAARNYPIDIALVDFEMSGMDGCEIMRALKKKHNWIQIVVLTSHDNMDLRAVCKRDLAYACMQKPCELDRLVKIITLAYEERIKEGKMDNILEIVKSSSHRHMIRKLRDFNKQDC